MSTTSIAISNLPQEEQEALKAAVFQRLHPRVYFERFLAEKLRPDGREFDAWRPVSVNVGSISTADGSALVRLGDTTVVCGVKVEIAEPELDRPEEGFLVPNLDLPAICSPKFKPGPPTEEAQALSDRLNEVLATSVPFPPRLRHFLSSIGSFYFDRQSTRCIMHYWHSACEGSIFTHNLLLTDNLNFVITPVHAWSGDVFTAISSPVVDFVYFFLYLTSFLTPS